MMRPALAADWDSPAHTSLISMIFPLHVNLVGVWGLPRAGMEEETAVFVSLI